MVFTLSDQIKCVTREISLRKRIYPVWVLKNKMKQEHADYEIDCMQSVLDLLQEKAKGF